MSESAGNGREHSTPAAVRRFAEVTLGTRDLAGLEQFYREAFVLELLFG